MWRRVDSGAENTPLAATPNPTVLAFFAPNFLGSYLPYLPGVGEIQYSVWRN